MCDDCISLPKTGKTLNDMDDEDENIYMTSVYDRYVTCPNCIKNMCLANLLWHMNQNLIALVLIIMNKISLKMKMRWTWHRRQWTT